MSASLGAEIRRENREMRHLKQERVLRSDAIVCWRRNSISHVAGVITRNFIYLGIIHGDVMLQKCVYEVNQINTI